MSDEKTQAIDNLITANQHMLDFSKQIQKFYDQAITFLNRCDDIKYFSKIGVTEDDYDRKLADFPEYLFDYWYSPQEKKPFKSIEDQIVKSMIDSLKLEDTATVFPGKTTVLGSGLYAAWKIFPNVRDDIYLVIMQNFNSDNVYSWFLEGNLMNYYRALASGKLEMVNGSPADFGTIYSERTQNSEL
ncbi:MAG: hypothetical protein KAS11_05505 [Candidatus Aenigmarchaeota archaeon]|nr:hypothetical protein [Candidatus Aenigmarchaeota archaeon]